jgi:phospholipid/cholesterol/gamma-HCH transport system substrate-binding protein
MSKSTTLIVATACAALALVGVFFLIRPPSYQLKLIVPSAAQLVVGSPVRIKDNDVGKVTDIGESDGRAIVTVALSGDEVPLHEGTTAKVDWQSVLGERLISIQPGPKNNLEIPSGAMYEAQATEVEADQVLAALNKPTRDHLNSMIEGLHQVTDGQEQNIQQTLRSAGPSVQALGNVLQAVGRDGPAIKTLVSELERMAGGLAIHQDRLSGTVRNVATLANKVATRKDQLAEGLREVPPTLDTARVTLDKIPTATDATIPLLDKLRPGIERLPSVANNLKPVMRDLRPIARDLRPTINDLADLFKYAPRFMDSAHHALPPLAETVGKLGPAVESLRPYTPEFMGWLANFGSGFSGYDSQGKFWAITPGLGPADIESLPGTVPPYHMAIRPAPGAAVGQPWTDANGDGQR